MGGQDSRRCGTEKGEQCHGMSTHMESKQQMGELRFKTKLHLPFWGNPHEAQDYYEGIGQTLEKKVDNDKLNYSKEVVKAGNITKCTGVLMRFFVEEQDLPMLRSKVQTELKWLRSLGIQEKQALHPLLFTQVSKALAMRL
eukprot:6492373-Amphidinium_carterae.3